MSLLAEGRLTAIQRLESPPPPAMSSLRKMPAEPDLLWDLLALDTRHDELLRVIPRAPHTKAIGIVQEMRLNRERAAILREQLLLSESDVVTLCRDTAPVIYGVSFVALDEDGGDAPAMDQGFVVSLRGRGLAFVEDVSAALDVTTPNSVRSVGLTLSRRSPDWEYAEFIEPRSLLEIGAVAGSHGVVTLRSTLKSGRVVVRAVKRFTCG